MMAELTHPITAIKASLLQSLLYTDFVYCRPSFTRPLMLPGPGGIAEEFNDGLSCAE